MKPIGYFTGYDPQTGSPSILHDIQEEWGGQLQHATWEQKVVWRSALTGYIAEKPVWVQGHPDGVDCIDSCIESAGVSWNIWEEDEKLVETIRRCCEELTESDIEGLTLALTEQIRSKTYASRGDY
jgi:hypothetical protein